MPAVLERGRYLTDHLKLVGWPEIADQKKCPQEVEFFGGIMLVAIISVVLFIYVDPNISRNDNLSVIQSNHKIKVSGK